MKPCHRTTFLALLFLCFARQSMTTAAQQEQRPTALPPPPTQLAPWAMAYGPEVPGEVSAAGLLDKPAGRLGPVTVRDGHFYTGDRRLRFWGASIVFSAALPDHEQADRVARRLANFGINCVRFHHIDMQPFPGGLFADGKLETLSPEALDRLDYFIAALKAQGVYSDLNLHVSRNWARVHHWPDADKLQEFDKQVDVFYPDLIAANTQYARDLLTHVNAYTKTRYADEPAVAFVEINNEDTLFLWGGEEGLAKLPDPYAKVLQGQWNAWLVKKYGTVEKLKAAWSAGAEPEGPDLMKNPLHRGVAFLAPEWQIEQHGSARMESIVNGAPDDPQGLLKIRAVDGTNWHLQLACAGLHLKKGQFYTLTFTARADHPRRVGVSVGQAHEPWQTLGLSSSCEPGPARSQYRFGFTTPADDANARVSFQLGDAVGDVDVRDVRLSEGGRRGLAGGEDPARGTVARGGMGSGDSAARARDWYDFLQQTDEAYFTGMRQFLRDHLGVKCPITGTIGLGPLGTDSQSKMDFVDAHAYWQHPRFPRRQWDVSDWEIENTPMVDDPAGAALWGLAATRVAGKPFTVTEYQHPAPSDWQAEGIPMIASYAALQDWDGVFLFDYVDSNTKYEPAAMPATDFFSLEGNPAKMAMLPLAARLFLGGAVQPLAAEKVVHPARERMLDTAPAYFYQTWPFVRDVEHVTWEEALHDRLSLDFAAPLPGKPAPAPADDRVAWTSAGPASGTGWFRMRDPHAAVFVGFARGGMPADSAPPGGAGPGRGIDLGPLTVEKLESPFAALMLVPAEPGGTIESASRLLLCAAAREENTGMRWDAARHSVSNHWGGPPALIEVVHATLKVAGGKPWTAYALTPEGKRGEKMEATAGKGETTIRIGSQPTLWYELARE